MLMNNEWFLIYVHVHFVKMPNRLSKFHLQIANAAFISFSELNKNIRYGFLQQDRFG